MRWLMSFMPRLWANWITLLGTVTTTISSLGIIVFALIETFGVRSNPYSGIFAMLFLMMFVGGLLLIPIGFFVDRWMKRRHAAAGVTSQPDPIIQAFILAIREPRARKLILFVGALTVVNVVLVAIGGVRAINYMDTPQFCGAACHTPMEPEWTAYKRSPHQNVQCVECHIGPGGGALIAAKLNGMHQLLGVVLNNYHRPIPAPVAHMRSNAETCENCHSPARYIGDVPKMMPHYKPTVDNAPSFNVLIDHVGGLDARSGKYTGIHSHLAPNRSVVYEYLDEKRTQIGKITVMEDGKVKTEYVLPGDEGHAKALGTRTMECTDCHNRPTHRFDGTARQAVDKALWSGELDNKQPYLAKVATELLEKANVPSEGAEAYFKFAMNGAYAALDQKPVPADLDKAAVAVAHIYTRNVFPKMNVTWNTYPDRIGHYTETDNDAVGCLRCHDGKHQATLADGRIKKMDKSCDLCHAAIETGVAPDKFEDAVKQMVGIPLD